MQEQWNKPITYARFWDRLKFWWKLKTAIETPNTKLCTKETSIDKNEWREFVMLALCDADLDDYIQIKSLDDLLKMNRIIMPKPKPTLWDKFKKRIKRK